MLDLVGLTGSARQRFGTYSLGMKQRLAIAATLLRDPDLVILDEPTNGLDPEGIRDTREMMRGLADMGKAVLVSTHHLGAVEEILDTVSVIKDGHLVAEGRLTDILPARAGSGSASAPPRVLPSRHCGTGAGRSPRCPITSRCTVIAPPT